MRYRAAGGRRLKVLSQETLENFSGMDTFPALRALSSAVEHIVHTDGVAGSNPAVRTIFCFSPVVKTL